MIIVPIFNNGLYPINYMCNVTLNRYHAEIYFFPITCATEFVFMPPTSKKLRGHIGLGLSVQWCAVVWCAVMRE